MLFAGSLPAACGLFVLLIVVPLAFALFAIACKMFLRYTKKFFFAVGAAVKTFSIERLPDCWMLRKGLAWPFFIMGHFSLLLSYKSYFRSIRIHTIDIFGGDYYRTAGFDWPTMLFLIVGVIFITIALVSFGRKREGKNENDGIAKPPQLVDAASHRAKGGENLSLKVRGETPHPRVEEVLQLPQTNQHNNMKKDNRWKDFNYAKYNYLRNKGANRNIGDEIEFAVLEKEKALMEGNAEDAIRAEKRYRALNKRWFTYIAWRFLPPIALIGICYLLYKLGVLK